jgi:dipeptidyl aminopeptidase/acylaminoacyl peptidase
VRLICLYVAISTLWAEPVWTPEYSMKVQLIGDVHPSPDGKLTAWTQVQRIVEPEKSEVRSHIWLGQSDGSPALQLTPDDSNCTSPSFSQDGRYVYFLSTSGGNKNVYRIESTGGRPEKITSFDGALGSYAISPNGKWLAFSGYEPSAETAFARKEKREVLVIDRDSANQTLYLMSLSPTGPKKAMRLLKSAYHTSEFVWSPDSTAIAFTHSSASDLISWSRSDVSEVDIETGRTRDIAATPAAEYSPRYSPDGRYIAYLRSSFPFRWAFDYRIVVVRRAGGETLEQAPTPDEVPQLFGWSEDSRSLLFTEPVGTRWALFAMPLGGSPRVLFRPARGTISAGLVNYSGKMIGFTFESPDQAPEAYLLRAGSPTPVRVSNANTSPAWPPLGKEEIVHWTSTGGQQIEGLLIYPVRYQTGRKYPLVVVLHGGPTGVVTQTFIGGPGHPIAELSQQGYAVLLPNIRGSQGYGLNFRLAIYKDWGGVDYSDVQAGVDHLIATGIADPDRLGIIGWSYGGYMTAWSITQTTRFKAAAAGAILSDLTASEGLENIRWWFDADFRRDSVLLRERSPITHVATARTPMLILQGSDDALEQGSQSLEFYWALKTLGVPTEMVVYPHQGHLPSDPKMLIDMMQRELQWMARYIRMEPQ